MPLWIQSSLFCIPEFTLLSQGSDGEVIQISEVHELLTEIPDKNHDNALCKWFGSASHI